MLCDVSIESECPMLCLVGSSHRSACVDGELAVLVRRFRSDIVSDELVPGSCEVRILLKALSVDDLALRLIGGCAVVDHLERFLWPWTSQQKDNSSPRRWHWWVMLWWDCGHWCQRDCPANHVVPTDDATDSRVQCWLYHGGYFSVHGDPSQSRCHNRTRIPESSGKLRCRS